MASKADSENGKGSVRAGLPLRVALLDHADPSSPGSMRAYADTLFSDLRQYSPDIDIERIRGLPAGCSRPGSKLGTILALPLAAIWGQLRRNTLWHVIDGSRAYSSLGIGANRVVVTCHDVIPELQALGRFSNAPPVSRMSRFLWRANHRAVGRAVRAVCDSESTARDVMQCAPVEKSRLQVVPLPIRRELRDAISSVRQEPVAHPATREMSVLHVGNNGFYKNRIGVLRIFAMATRPAHTRLVMLGPAPSGALVAEALRLGIAERTDWETDASDEVLKRHYLHSRALIFPSHYEGYGWPILEAMHFGLPFVCSGAGSLPEVAGGICMPFDSTDEAGMASDLSTLLHDDDAWTRRSQAGTARAATYSGERFAKEMAAFYRQACGVAA